MGAGRPPRQVLSECCEERHGAPNPLPDAGIARRRSIERRRLVHSRAHTHVLVQRTFLGLRLEAKPCSRYQSYRCGKNSSGAFSLRASHTVGVTRKAVDSPILRSDFLTRALKATQGNATRGGLARRLQGCGGAGHETERKAGEPTRPRISTSWETLSFPNLDTTPTFLLLGIPPSLGPPQTASRRAAPGGPLSSAPLIPAPEPLLPPHAEQPATSPPSPAKSALPVTPSNGH